MRFFWAFLFSVLFAALVGWGGYEFWKRYEKSSTNFDKTYNNVLTLIQDRKYKEAYDNLLLLSRVAETQEQWTRILKESYMFAQGAGEFSLLSLVSQKATQSYPNNELFWVFRVYSALRMHNYSNAYEWSLANLKTPAYDPIKKEAFLAYLWGNEGGEDSFFSKIEKEQDPFVFEEIGDLLNSPAFYYNSSLLYLREGDFESAHRIFSKISSSQNYTRYFAFLAYQAKEWDWALENIEYLEEEDPSLLLLMSDIFLMKRDYQNAYYTNQKLLEEYPNFAIAPYVNSAIILLKEGKKAEALEIAERGFFLFPDEPEYIYYYALILNYLGRGEEALMLINPWLSSSFKIKFLNYYLQSKDSSLEAKVIYLWELWREYKNTDLALFMLGEFSKNNLWYDFDLLFKDIPSYFTNENDFNSFLAYRAFQEGDLEKAKTLFFDNVEELNEYKAYFNVGLLYYSQKDFQNTLEYFNQSLILAPFSSYENTLLNIYEKNFLAKIYLYKALSEYYSGDVDQSYLSLLKARDLEKDNILVATFFYNLFPNS